MAKEYLLRSVNVHTKLCDGKNTLEELALSAWKAGLKTLGFSGHSHTPGGPHPARRPCPLPPIRCPPAALPAPPACSPVGCRSCRPGPLRHGHSRAGGVLCARSGLS